MDRKDMKKKYTKPTFTTIGDLKKITQAGQAGSGDFALERS